MFMIINHILWEKVNETSISMQYLPGKNNIFEELSQAALLLR